MGLPWATSPRSRRFLKPLRWLVILGLLASPLIAYGCLHLQRPPRLSQTRRLFPGMVYTRQARSEPRPLMIHIVKLDLHSPGLKVLVSPGLAQPTPDQEAVAHTTAEFLSQFKVQLAINANFFFPFREKTPWDYYPHSGDPVNLVGQAISNGSEYSQGESDWPVLCFAASQRARILASGQCPAGTAQAVAGNLIFLAGGQPTPLTRDSADSQKPYPRTAVALDRAGQTLWLILIDGKQPLYSEGVTLAELSQITQQLGADTALNLDGGGSTTLVVATPSGPQLLNAPIHTKLPLRQRPLANQLGFYARPQAD